MRARTDKQLRALADRIGAQCEGNTSSLLDWLGEGNRCGYLDGRRDKETIDEWNEYTRQAHG